MNKFLSALFLACMMLFTSSAFAGAEDSPGKKQLEASITKLIATLSDKTLAQDRPKRREAIKEILNARFSAEEMAKRTLAKEWLEISPAEQADFAETLRRLIISSYIGKIEEYRDEEVIFQNEKILKDRYMEIETTVVGGKDNYAVNYKLKDFDGEWLVYDIHIEGVSLISNYKTQFDAVLKKKTFTDLLNQLKDALQAIEKADLDNSKKS